MTPPAANPEALFVERPILSRRQRAVVRLVAPVLLAVLGAWLGTDGRIQALERLSIDLRFRHRGPLRPDPRIVIVEITEQSRRALSESREGRFELRQHLDDAIRHLADAGVVAIGVDVRLQGHSHEALDAELARAISETNTVLAVAYAEGHVIRPARVFRDAQPHEGVIAVHADADGVLRRLPRQPNLDVLDDDNRTLRRIPFFPFVLTHLLLAEAETAQGRPAPPLDLTAPDHARIAGRAVPYGRLVNFAAGPRQGFASLSFDAAAKGRLGIEGLDGAVVLIGDTRSVIDRFRMPLADELQPGIYYHANVIDAILHDRLLTEWPPPGAAAALLAAFLGCASGAYFWNLREWWRMHWGYAWLALYFGLGAAVLLGGWHVLCRRAFAANVVLPMAAPLLAMIAAAVTALAGHTVVSVAGARRLARRNRGIEVLFARHVSPQVLAAIKSDPTRIGRIDVREITVMFCDMRRFTSKATTMPPSEVATMLNEYFDAIASAVLEHDGFIDKFVGDELMAVFNVPLEQPDHAVRAARAAIAVKQRLRELNARRAARGDLPLDCGIGIHCGPAAAGHIGVARRANYTVVGDTVNIASRIQGMASGGEILISEELAVLLPSDLSVRAWKTVELRGSGRQHALREIVAD